MFRAVLALLAAAAATTGLVWAQSPALDLLVQQGVQQSRNRAQLWGTGPDIRFLGDVGALLSAGRLAWPTVPQLGAGVVSNGRIAHPTLGVSAPIEHGPCRMLDFSPLPSGIGGGIGWLCPPDHPLSFATVTFEQVAHDPNTIAQVLFNVDEQTLGVSAPRCVAVPAPAGLERMQRCESTFPHGASQGRLVGYVGGRQDFFVRALTACAGSQCDAALPQFEALVATISFEVP